MPIWEWVVRLESRRQGGTELGDPHSGGGSSPAATIPPPLAGYQRSLSPAVVLLGVDPGAGAVHIHPVLRAIVAQCIQQEHLRGKDFDPNAVKVDIALAICHRISQLHQIVSRVISDESGVQKWAHAEAAHEVWVQGGFIPGGIRKSWRGRRCEFEWESPIVADILGCGDSGVPRADWPARSQPYFPRITREGLGREFPPQPEISP